MHSAVAAAAKGGSFLFLGGRNHFSGRSTGNNRTPINKLVLTHQTVNSVQLHIIYTFLLPQETSRSAPSALPALLTVSSQCFEQDRPVSFRTGPSCLIRNRTVLFQVHQDRPISRPSGLSCFNLNRTVPLQLCLDGPVSFGMGRSCFIFELDRPVSFRTGWSHFILNKMVLFHCGTGPSCFVLNRTVLLSVPMDAPFH